tara:strand:+ start:41 stop:517 length:477 start_codon:yes stop_codon:yes gene_type:complete
MEFIPESPNTFQGNQVIINSDRLIFNAKEDAILAYSDKAIGFTTRGNFHFDTDNSGNAKFIVNSPNIYLGISNLRTGELPTEPAVLGHELKSLLEQLLDLLEMMTLDMCYNVAPLTTQPGTPTGMNPANSSIMQALYSEIDGIRANIDDIMSQNTKLV